MKNVLIKDTKKATYNLGNKVKKSKYLILMIIPAIIYYLVFCYFPMYGILIAFQRFNAKKGVLGSQFNNFENFKFIFNDPDFFRVLKNTLVIGTCKILISFVAAIVVALLLNEIRMKVFKKNIQILVTFPHFLSWVVVAGFIINIFSRYGPINSLIQMSGNAPVDFMNNGDFFLTVVFSSDVWKEAGWSSIIYLATMAGINPELYEAADIDGASRLKKIWNITLPAIKPTAILLLILSVGGVLSAGFDQLYNLMGNNSLVYKVGDILDTYIYRITFVDFTNPGIGAAIGLFKSVVSFILVLSVDRIAKLSGERGII